MDEQFVPLGIKDIAVKAADEASRRGSGTVEAEHVLLALAAQPASLSGRALAVAGLDHAAIETALDDERARSLAYVGIVAATDGAHSPPPRRCGRPTWGASVGYVLGLMRREHGSHRDSNLSVALLRAVLAADIGTVPRALAIAGVDRVALRDSLDTS